MGLCALALIRFLHLATFSVGVTFSTYTNNNILSCNTVLKRGYTVYNISSLSILVPDGFLLHIMLMREKFNDFLVSPSSLNIYSFSLCLC